MVEGLDYDISEELELCEACIGGKHHRSKFDKSSTLAQRNLWPWSTDVCGKLNTRSLGGAEYFVTFVDDSTHYVWVYPLKHKDEVFPGMEALVEKSSGHMLKSLRTDNGGEYKVFEIKVSTYCA